MKKWIDETSSKLDAPVRPDEEELVLNAVMSGKGLDEAARAVKAFRYRGAH